MKASLILTLIALAGAGLLGWRGHTRMEAARETQRTLERKVKNHQPPVEGSRQAIRKPEIDVKSLVDEMLAIRSAGKEASFEKSGRELALLDERGMRDFVASLQASPLDDAAKGKLVLIVMKAALSDRPRAALSLFDAFSSAGGKTDPKVSAQLVPDALQKLAAEDADAALDWLGKKDETYPAILTAPVKLEVLMTAAASDPQQAFRAIGTIGFDEPQDAVCAIMRSGNAPAQRLATIAALREHLASMPDERLKKERSEAAMTHLALSAVYGGEEVARQWLAAAKFTPAEMEDFSKEIANKAVIPGEIGSWVECLAAAGAETFPGQPVHKMVEYWTRHDYRAAGEWLLTTRDGPAKQAAVRAYAETVAKYEPEVAEQWAMTLPEGKDRDATLAKIHGK
jgi:hypothetical protein